MTVISLTIEYRSLSGKYKALLGRRYHVELIKRTTLPLLWLTIITYFGQQFYLVNGQIDWFRMWILYGTTVGIPYSVITAPVGKNMRETMLNWMQSILFGALFGILIAIDTAIRAMVYMPIFYLTEKEKRERRDSQRADQKDE